MSFQAPVPALSVTASPMGGHNLDLCLLSLSHIYRPCCPANRQTVLSCQSLRLSFPLPGALPLPLVATSFITQVWFNRHHSSTSHGKALPTLPSSPAGFSCLALASCDNTPDTVHWFPCSRLPSPRARKLLWAKTVHLFAASPSSQHDVWHTGGDIQTTE